ncbi:hypothetical protein D9M68_940130 [compost metagenome]
MPAVGHPEPDTLYVPLRMIQSDEQKPDLEAVIDGIFDDLDRVMAAQGGFENEIGSRLDQLADTGDCRPTRFDLALALAEIAFKRCLDQVRIHEFARRLHLRVDRRLPGAVGTG